MCGTRRRSPRLISRPGGPGDRSNGSGGVLSGDGDLSSRRAGAARAAGLLEVDERELAEALELALLRQALALARFGLELALALLDAAVVLDERGGQRGHALIRQVVHVGPVVQQLVHHLQVPVDLRAHVDVDVEDSALYNTHY